MNLPPKQVLGGSLGPDPSWVLGMCDGRAGDFSRGARNREFSEAAEKRCARARDFWKAFYSNQTGFQTNFAEGHGMTCGREPNHLSGRDFHFEYFFQVSGQIQTRARRCFDGRELPHPREECAVI